MDLALGDEAGTVQSYMDRFVSRFTPAKKGANTKEAFEHVLQASKTKYGAYRQGTCAVLSAHIHVPFM